jgi:hypothetical protein
LSRPQPMKKTTLLFLLLLLGGSLGLRAQTRYTERIVIPLSRPDRPATLAINHEKGSISVLGYEGETVIVEAVLREPPAGEDSDPSARGMKLIPAREIQLSGKEIDNTVTVTANSRDKTLDLNVKVPRRTSLRLGTVHNGRIDVVNVTGDMEISNLNGDIRLDGVSGSAVLNTFDGNITAVFLQAAPDAPMAFTTVYGKIDVTFPPDVRMLAKIKTDNGRIFSDFDLQMEPRKTRREDTPKTGEKRVVLEDWTYGRINGGGPEMLFKSFDGNIYLRKTKAGQ